MAGLPAEVKRGGAAPRGGWCPGGPHRPRRGRGAYWRPREKRGWQALVHDSLADARYFLQRQIAHQGFSPGRRPGNDTLRSEKS